MRVVSLLPSVSETLRAWGVTPIAVSRFCEQPDLPTVGGTKDPDVAAIVALRPDLVVVDREENRREDADALVAAGVPLHVTHVTSLADVAPTLAALAAAVGLGAPPPAPAPADVPPDPVARRRAFVPIWRRPWMTCNGDTYGMSLLRSVGIDGIFDDAPDRYPTVTLEEAAAGRPDLVLLPSEPYPFADRHRAELRAVADDVRLIDGRDLYWWGVRTAAARPRLAAALA